MITRVKICGVTSPGDAALSLSLGADYIGLIFADSKRRVSPQVAMEIRRSVPDALLVGVFVNESFEAVVDIAKRCGLNMIQLHGDESPSYVDALIGRLRLPVIKAFSYSQLDKLDQVHTYSRASYFLFDLDKGTNPKKANGKRDRVWEEAAALRGKGYRIFLSGGLDPDNVTDALNQVSPNVIDVASGVEQRPGVKDSVALKRFMKEVKG